MIGLIQTQTQRVPLPDSQIVPAGPATARAVELWLAAGCPEPDRALVEVVVVRPEALARTSRDWFQPTAHEDEPTWEDAAWQ